MTKKHPASKNEELLRVAVDVVAGRRDEADLAAHGVTLGEPASGGEAKKMLLEQLESEDAEDRVANEAIDLACAELARHGIERGARARFEVIFLAKDPQAATLLAAEYAADGEEWETEIGAPRDGVGRPQVKLITRPLVAAREVLEVLTDQMRESGRAYACEFVGIRLVSAPHRRPWWKIW